MFILALLFLVFTASIGYFYFYPERRLEKIKEQTDIFGVLHPDEFL
jgi:hypothetical protein